MAERKEGSSGQGKVALGTCLGLSVFSRNPQQDQMRAGDLSEEDTLSINRVSKTTEDVGQGRHKSLPRGSPTNFTSSLKVKSTGLCEG